MNIVDTVILVLAISYAIAGYTQGFIVGLASFVGFVGGAVGGLLLAPRLLAGLDPGLGTAVLALVLVLVLATLGQGVTAWLGTLMRRQVRWRSVRFLDSLGGALFSVLALLLAAWAIGLAAASSTIPTVSAALRESTALRTVDDVLPDESRQVVGRFRDLVGAGAFPSVVLPFQPEPIAGVDAPALSSVRAAAVRSAGRSVVKVLGEAPACQRVLEGSGFVVAPQRVMTNAHVLAGVTELVVVTQDDERLSGEVIYFDPEVDVAVIAVPDLRLPVLSFSDAAKPGLPAAALGYPRNGPYRAEPVRVRAERSLLGEDIYGERSVNRDIVSVRGRIQPGNSGGPVVAEDGGVIGMVFAASLTDPDTGYALTPEEVAPALRASGGGTSPDPVDTGPCRL